MTVPLALLIRILRGYREALRARAAAANAEGHADAALALWHVTQDVGAFIDLLIAHRHRRSAGR